MSSNESKSNAASGPTTGLTPPLPPVSLPDLRPLVTEAQRAAAETSVSGRRAVSRGTMLLAFYLWLLSGAVILSLIARRNPFLPGDMTITTRLQKWRNPWVRHFFFGVSEIGFAKMSIPLVLGVSGLFWALRFRLEAIFLLLTSSSTLINMLIKRMIKRPRPTKELVTVRRIFNEPSFPSGHVMHYMNFYGLLAYLLATNWRSGRLRNVLITICTLLIACIGPSRVYLGAHWPSDVMAGYLYGGLWFAGLMALYLRIKAWVNLPKSKTTTSETGGEPFGPPTDGD